jgi:enoyl-CoA hydratase/carnithine racemase
MELALCCDILIGDSTVVFRDTHVQFGLAPCWGLSQRLSQRIGPGRAKLISWTAQPIRAALAYEWGLLDELVVVNNDDVNKAVHGEETDKNTPAVLQRALEIAHAIGQNQSTMVQRYKRVMKTTCDDDEFLSTLTRERALALAHYLQVYGTNGGETSPTFANAKDFVTSKSRRRRSNASSKL